MSRTELIERLAAQNSLLGAESGRIVETLLEAASSADDERAHIARPCEMSRGCAGYRFTRLRIVVYKFAFRKRSGR